MEFSILSPKEEFVKGITLKFRGPRLKPDQPLPGNIPAVFYKEIIQWVNFIRWP